MKSRRESRLDRAPSQFCARAKLEVFNLPFAIDANPAIDAFYGRPKGCSFARACGDLAEMSDAPPRLEGADAQGVRPLSPQVLGRPTSFAGTMLQVLADFQAEGRGRVPLGLTRTTSPAPAPSLTSRGALAR